MNQSKGSTKIGFFKILVLLVAILNGVFVTVAIQGYWGSISAYKTPEVLENIDTTRRLEVTNTGNASNRGNTTHIPEAVDSRDTNQTPPEVAFDERDVVDQLPPPPDLLLSVPFYVYEEISWLNATVTGHKRAPSGSLEAFNMYHAYNGTIRFKQGDDYFFLKAAMNHPMRTRNIDEAKLFFVPTLLNMYDYFVWREKKKFCVNSTCGLDLLDHARKHLEKSKAFRLYPQKHIIVQSHWGRAGANRKFRGEPKYKRFILEMTTQMSRITFETERVEFRPYPNPKYTLPTYKVGTPCPQGIFKEKTLDFVMIADMKFSHRKWLCKSLEKAASTMNVTSLCGKANRCPAMAQAKFGFHIIGDTAGSQRLMDTILAGTVPIFTHVSQFEAQGEWIDWKQLSYYIPIHNISDAYGSQQRSRFPAFTNEAVQGKFLKRIERILNDTAGYERRHQAVLDHVPLFDYTTLYPFDTYMYLFQAQLYPETRHARSKFSALMLPPVLYSEQHMMMD